MFHFLPLLLTAAGDHCTGDGIKMAVAIGADVKDITAVQVHPTGLVHPDEPDAKLKAHFMSVHVFA